MKKQLVKNGKMTLEKLARMIQVGFEETSSKKEVQALREEMNERFYGMDNKIDALYLEIKEIKSVLPPLFKAMGQFDIEVINLRQRVSRLEKKIGLSK